MNSFKFLFFSFFFSSLRLIGLTLNPNDPVQIGGSTTLSFSSIAIAGNALGFMAVWNGSHSSTSGLFYSTSIDNGATWSDPQLVPGVLAPQGDPSIAANDSGFLIVIDEGVMESSSYTNYAIFVEDLGATWRAPHSFNNSSNKSSSTVSATDRGFLVTWSNLTTGKIDTAFSSDGVNWNPTVNTTVSGFTPESFPVGVGYGNNFLVTCQGLVTSAAQGISVFSSDDGSSWSSKSVVADNYYIDSSYAVSPAYYNGTFVATWKDSVVTKIMSSTSSDNGQSWGVPSEVTNQTDFYGSEAIPVLGTSKGFFAGVHSDTDTGLVFISEDAGASWPYFVDVTAGIAMSGSISNPCLSLAKNYAGIMTAWFEYPNGYVYTAFIPLAFTESVEPPTNAAGNRYWNVFPGQKQAYVSLSWTPSVTENLSGYKIYRDDVFLGTTTSSKYIDYQVKTKSAYRYQIIAYTEDSESAPAEVVITAL